MILEVLSGGQVIGRVEPEAFRACEGVPRSLSLPEAVSRWNAWKADLGDPERVRIAL